MPGADDITPDELLAISEEMAAGYPPPRAGTELVLLDVNPHRAHACWHVDPDDLRAAQQRAPNAPLVIRMHDVTGVEFDGRNAHDTSDTLVHGLQGQIDLNVRRDGRTYLAEFGLRRPDGHLERLAMSDRIEMPRAPLPSRAEKFSSLREQMDQMPVEAPAARPVAAVPEVGPWPTEAELASLLPARDAAVEAWYDAAVPIASPISFAHQTMEVEVRDVPADIPVEPTSSPATISGANVLQFPVQRAAPSPIRLEDFLGTSSHNLGVAETGVELHVDVIVHGRVPAGRSVTLFGREVAVDADGRFSLRQELTNPGAVLPYVWSALRPAGD